MSDRIELDLTGMAHGGSAVGRHDGRAIFVAYALPGERVALHIRQDKGRFAIADLVEVLEPSPDRVIPPCPHFGPGQCGGCQWQHIAYKAQLRYKRQIVADQLARIGGLHKVPVHPVIPSPAPWAYRSHITFHFTADGQPGFVGTDNRTVIPVRECHIIRPGLLDLVRSPTSRLHAGISLLRALTGSAGDPLTFPLADEDGPADAPGGAVTYTVHGRAFRCSAGSFFQVNLAGAETLVDLVLDQLALRGDERVLDLYSGVGLFTAFLAERAREVVAVESFEPAVRDAQANLDAFEHVALYLGVIEDILPVLRGRFQAVVLDPPRSGMSPSALKALLRQRPERIVYVSCDPATLSRDAKALTAAGYRLLEVQPVDMFPQTYHIESVALFFRE